VEVDPKSVDARLSLAVFQLQIGDAATAEQTLRSALEIDPKHPVANRAMALLYISSKRVTEAEPYLKAFAAASPSVQSSFILADYYVATNRIADAKAVLEPLTKNAASAADAQSRLAQLEYGTDQAAAHKRIDEVLQKNPQHLPSLLLKGRWLLAEDKPAESLARALAAVKAAPNNPGAHYLAGTAHAQLHDINAAIASFNEVLRLNPRVGAAQLQLSRLELARGATTEAVKLAEDALRTLPGSSEAQLTLAGTLIAKRDLGRAEPLVATLLKEHPNASVVQSLNGMLLLAKKNLVGARAAYEHALKLDPKSFQATAGLSAIDLVEKKTADAVARIDARVADSPNEARVLLLAARVYAAAGQADKAERVLRKTVEVSPSDSTAYGMLGQIYVAQGKLNEARAEFDRMAERDPKNTGVRTIAAMLSHTTNDLADAKKRYREILENDANAVVAANNLAWILADEGKDLDEALRLAQRAIAGAPERAEIQDTLGWVYYRKELPGMAIPPFEKSASLAPDNPTYHYHLGLALAKNGDVEGARKAVDTALKLNPNLAEAKQLQATLR